jgi:predicted secreted protein
MTAPRDLIDMSVKQNFPFKNKRPGWFDWSVDCDGLLMANGEGSFVSLVAKEIEGTEVDVVVTITDSGEQLAGKAFMTNVEMDAPQDKEGTMTCKLEGNGTLTPTEGV